MTPGRANAAALAVADDTVARILERTPSRALLSPADISAAMGVSPDLVRGWMACGALPCIHIGNGKRRAHRRVARSTFARFLALRAEAEGTL